MPCFMAKIKINKNCINLTKLQRSIFYQNDFNYSTWSMVDYW